MRDRLAVNSVGVEMDCIYSAIHRGIVILAAGGNANQLGLDVLGDDPNLLDVDFATDESRQRRAGADHHGGGAGDARAGRRLGMRLQQKPLLGLKEAHEVCRQRVAGIVWPSQQRSRGWRSGLRVPVSIDLR